MKFKLVNESLGDILRPKTQDDIKSSLRSLSQEEKNEQLLNASRYGHLNVVKWLVEAGTDIEDKNNYGRTALMWASENGHLNVVKYLKEQGTKE